MLFSVFTMSFCRREPHKQIQDLFPNIATPQVNPCFKSSTAVALTVAQASASASFWALACHPVRHSHPPEAQATTHTPALFKLFRLVLLFSTGIKLGVLCLLGKHSVLEPHLQPF